MKKTQTPSWSGKTGGRAPTADDCRPGTESDLVRRCLAGEAGAWEEFLDRYSRLVYSTIHRVGLPADDRDDAFQATIMAVYRQLPSLRSQEKLIPWIIAIAWRQAINQIRLRSREVTRNGAEMEQIAGPEPSSPSLLPPDERRLELERAQQALEALDSISQRCRRLLALFFYSDPPMDYAEIARREGIPLGSLGPTRARCLAKVRQYFQSRGWLGD